MNLLLGEVEGVAVLLDGSELEGEPANAGVVGLRRVEYRVARGDRGRDSPIRPVAPTSIGVPPQKALGRAERLPIWIMNLPSPGAVRGLRRLRRLLAGYADLDVVEVHGGADRSPRALELELGKVSWRHV